MRSVLYWFPLVLLCLNPTRVGAATVYGKVVDESGGIVVRAPVGLYAASGNWETETDESGRFVLDNVPQGHYEFQVVVPGFMAHFDKDYEVGTIDPPPLSITLRVGSNPPCFERWFHGLDGPCYFGGQTTYTDTLGKPALTGRVSIFNRSGQPLGDATVVLTKMGQKQPFAESRTDEKGQFQFSDLDVGRYEVWVKHDGCSDSGAPNVRIKCERAADIAVLTGCPPAEPQYIDITQ